MAAKTAVSLVRCASYDLPKIREAVRRSVSLLGLDPALFRGRKVLLKPNMLYAAPPSRHATTHPSVVRAVAELIQDSGASEIRVGDSPGFGTSLKCLKVCGILEALEGLDVKPAEFKRPAALPNPGGFIREYTVAQEAFECDLIVNLPKLKTHTQMVLTCAVKNLYGLVVGMTKGQYHLTAGKDNGAFARVILELCYLRKPALTVVDAVTAMHGNGPGSGEPFDLGLILAGTDPLAVDYTAAGIVGIPREQIPIFAVAKAQGKGFQDPGDITFAGESPEAVRAAGFRPADGGRGFARIPGFIINPLKKSMAIKPRINQSVCKLCGECVALCPPKAMKEEGRKIKIDRKACIRCFCCQELCPHGAITAERNLAGRLLTRVLR